MRQDTQQQTNGEITSLLSQSPPDLTRFRRDRAIVLGLLFFVSIVLIIYLITTVTGAQEIRRRHAFERNESTARLCAQLLHEECDSAFDVLEALARRPTLELNIQQGKRVAASDTLQDAVELVPDMLAVAIYRADGQLWERYPRTVPLPANAGETHWFRRASDVSVPPPYINEVIRLPDTAQTEAFTVAIPIGKRTHPAGYLFACFRLGDFYKWLRMVRIDAGSVLIVDNEGRIVARKGAGPATSLNADFPVPTAAFRRARAGRHGALLTRKIGTLPSSSAATRPGEMVVGYAFATRPGWSVLVIQPTDAAFAPTDYLLRRFSRIAIILLFSLLLTGWGLLYLYGRQQRLAFALSDRNEMLRRANRAKSDLLANVSHDLKTPIAGMQLSVSGLLEADRLPNDDLVPRQPTWDEGQVTECLTLVSQELDQLAARVRNLLDMARLEGDATPPWREPCDLMDIVAGALERLRPLTADRAITATFPPTPILIECDPSQMETVVLNLLENALKYSPAGSPLFLEGSIRAGQAYFRLQDEGPGIPAGDEERIFEKFYRAATPHSAGGTGLGLAICKTIVESHGGRIYSRTRQEGGAEFIVLVPLSSDAAILPPDLPQDPDNF